jgi:hypothetical protein
MGQHVGLIEFLPPKQGTYGLCVAALHRPHHHTALAWSFQQIAEESSQHPQAVSYSNIQIDISNDRLSTAWQQGLVLVAIPWLPAAVESGSCCFAYLFGGLCHEIRCQTVLGALTAVSNKLLMPVFSCSTTSAAAISRFSYMSALASAATHRMIVVLAKAPADTSAALAWQAQMSDGQIDQCMLSIPLACCSCAA